MVDEKFHTYISVIYRLSVRPENNSLCVEVRAEVKIKVHGAENTRSKELEDIPSEIPLLLLPSQPSWAKLSTCPPYLIPHISLMASFALFSSS
jgi:hypothetical protein